MVEHLWVYLTFDMPYCSKFEGAICVILTDTGEREHAGIEFTVQSESCLCELYIPSVDCIYQYIYIPKTNAIALM